MGEWSPARRALYERTQRHEEERAVFDFAVFLDLHGFLEEELDPFEVALWFLEARPTSIASERPPAGGSP